jgi:hypothetical protein
MNTPIYMILLTALRLLLPFALLLGVGEVIKRRDPKYWLKV